LTLLWFFSSSGSSCRRHDWSGWWSCPCFMGSIEGVGHRAGGILP
jgi:hypothetical protein